MKNVDIEKHVRGDSLFIDDIRTPEGTLHAYVYSSPVAHAKIKMLDISEVKKYRGVVDVLTINDIPGVNEVGAIIQDEELLAEDVVVFIGQPIALVIAETKELAKKAAQKIKFEYEVLEVITDPREAFEKGFLIQPIRIFSSGDVDAEWEKCDNVFSGRVDSGGQEHIYLETQGAFAVPCEGGKIKIYSSTQSPTSVQRVTAGILDLPMHQIEVDVLRLGGAFGGKEDQATHWAALAALGTHKLNRPVKLVLSRMDDIKMTGKRHPYLSDFKIGLSNKGKILAYEVTFYQNAGASADLSTAILERTLFHVTNSYSIPNVKATGISCKTNLPPNTAFRGFGGPQAMFVIESAIYEAASKMGMSADKIQKANLITEGEKFYYGQSVENAQAINSWNKAETKYELGKIKNDAEQFNRLNNRYKKGVSLMPICFGISFTSSFLNQASALVHIYTDGSVGISTAAVEMGQGVNAKLREICAKIFSIDIERIKIETTNTTRVANTSATAASSGADLNGNAVILACNNILARLKNVITDKLKIPGSSGIEIIDERILVDNKPTKLYWNELIQTAYFNRVSLTSQAYYSTPDIHFDREKNKGHPFAYHVFGTAITSVTLDCLLGIYEIDSVKIVHDFGKSLQPKIDKGQVEGALAQGIGWMTLEELVQSENGELISNSLSTYKIPDFYAVPNEVEIDFLKNSKNKYGPFNSKAIGEPPLMYGIGVYFALMNAMKSYNTDLIPFFNAPLTPEKVLLSLNKEQ